MFKRLKAKRNKPKWSTGQPRTSRRKSIRLRYSQHSDKKLRVLTIAASLALFAVIMGTFGMFALFAFYSRELPDPDQLLERSDELSTKLFDSNGDPIFEVYGEKNRVLVKYDDVSQNLIDATLAIEDANFYRHQGFYFLGMLRAMKNTVTGQGLSKFSTRLFSA